MSRIVRLNEAARGALRQARAARRGGVAIIFALMVPVLAVCVFGGIDISQQLNARSRLQDATDAAALAVSATDAETPSSKKSDLKTVAGNLLAANFPAYGGSGGTPNITSFKICTTNQQDDCVGGQVTNTVTISTQVQAPCWAPLVMPGLCTSDGQSMLLTATNTTNVGLPSSIQWSFILDTSGSMIVGATPADVQAIENWNNTASNWAAVNDKAGTTPCAFACHDEAQQDQVTSGVAGSDMDQGITNAHKAILPNSITTKTPNGVAATTRYDVMLSAASEAISYIKQQVTTNSQLAQNSYYFNLYWMGDALNSAWAAKSTQPNDWTDAAAAVTRQNLPVGLDTHISTALAPLATSSWAGGSGVSYSSPKRVVFLVTDGLQSDFIQDFTKITSQASINNCGQGDTMDPTWGSQKSTVAWNCQGSSSQAWTGRNWSGQYATAISPTLCKQITDNGIVLAILETPYVPLTGQSPGLPLGGFMGQFFPYEQFIRPIIYPGGPNGSSTVSAALQKCASPGLYAQASSTDSTSIQAGLHTLVQAYLASNAFLKQ